MHATGDVRYDDRDPKTGSEQSEKRKNHKIDFVIAPNLETEVREGRDVG